MRAIYLNDKQPKIVKRIYGAGAVLGIFAILSIGGSWELNKISIETALVAFLIVLALWVKCLIGCGAIKP